MNVSLQNIDKVSALLTLKIEKSDYQAQVDKSLKSLRQNAQLPGFRKGMVPMNLIQKMYRKSAIAEEVNKLISNGMFEYIRDNKINILGEPLPNEEKQPEVDFDTMEDFEFIFDIALSPEINLTVTNDDQVEYYTIDVTEEMVAQQIQSYTQRLGSYEKVDVYEDKDMVKGLIQELDSNGEVKENGIRVENAVVMPLYMKDDAQKSIFDNAKVGDVLVFNPNTAYGGHEAEISSLLHIEQTDVAEMVADFSIQVEEITRFVEGKLDQELFDQTFGKDIVKTEEEFRAKVKETLAGQFVASSDFKFLIDARKVLVDKLGKIEYPEALLKRIMMLNNNDKEELVDENFEKSLNELTWHLVKEKLVKDYELKVEQEDIVSMAKEVTKAQFARYGMSEIPDEIVENYAKEMLSKKEGVDDLVNRVLESKLINQLKGIMKLDNKNISLEEFNKSISQA